MAVPNALFMWPIRFPVSGVYGLRSTQSVAQNLNFPSVTAGRNYWVSGDGQADADGGVGGTGDLLAMLDTCLESHASAQTYLVTLTNFRVRVEANTGTVSLEWANVWSTLDATIFGWTEADTALSSALTSPNLPQGIWMPKRPVAVDSRDRQPVVGGIATAISGLQRASAMSLPKKERDLLFKYLASAQTLEEYELATEPYGSFEYFFVNSLRLGRAFRYYPDATNLATNAYTLYVPRDLEDPIKRNDLHKLLWDVLIKARRV